MRRDETKEQVCLTLTGVDKSRLDIVIDTKNKAIDDYNSDLKMFEQELKIGSKLEPDDVNHRIDITLGLSDSVANKEETWQRCALKEIQLVALLIHKYAYESDNLAGLVTMLHALHADFVARAKQHGKLQLAYGKSQIQLGDKYGDTL